MLPAAMVQCNEVHGLELRGAQGHIAAMDMPATDAPLLGLLVMAGAFALFALLELLLPFRGASQSKGKRWFANLTLFAIDTLAVRLLLPLAMVGTAMLAAERGWGLFNVVEAPGWLALVVTVLALDLAIYLQHWATHRVPLLWRLHRVHHTDRDFDLTTAARFHPVEILLSTLYKGAVVVMLGAPAWAVFVFETGFAVLTLWTHTNLALPSGLDRIARWFVVTPTMHRIHHSERQPETDSNYGTFLSGWDRLFGTYTAQAKEPQEDMAIGLGEWRGEQTAGLGFTLLLPFRKS